MARLAARIRNRASQKKQHIQELKERAKQTTGWSDYEATLAFKKNKPLRRWFDAYCKGRQMELAPEIVAAGVKHGRITEQEGDVVLRVLGFAGERAFGRRKEEITPERMAEARAALEAVA